MLVYNEPYKASISNEEDTLEGFQVDLIVVAPQEDGAKINVIA